MRHDDEPKEKVIHTRVPESLENELRRRAESLGVSVSNLVRNVLGHAFGLVGDVVADSHKIARAATGTRSEPKPASKPSPELADVLAWQPMTMGKNAVCARCNELLPKGSSAALGTPEHGEGRVIVCSTCFQEVSQ